MTIDDEIFINIQGDIMCKSDDQQAIASELNTRESASSAEKTKRELAKADSEADKKVLEDLLKKGEASE
jgi:hypothetical protein